MTIGPAPMIRMLFISVRFGIMLLSPILAVWDFCVEVVGKK